MIHIAPGSVNGCLQANSSKSHMQRVVLAASMAIGETRIQRQGKSADDRTCIEAVKMLGAKVEQSGNILKIRSGSIGRIDTIDCGESGFCLRALAAIAALKDWSIKLVGNGSLASRPISMIHGPLVQLGAKCVIDDNVAAVTVHGPLVGGRATVNGAISSQFLSGLLLALPRTCEDSELFVTELCSKPYVRMTLDTMASFGVQVKANKEFNKFVICGNQNYYAIDTVIEGDWSGASFMLVAGAIAGEVTVAGLNRDSAQADRAILNVLESSGAEFQWNNQGLTVFKSNLRSFEFDATDCPDLFPPLVVLACCAKGTSRISGVMRLIHKESNRGAVLASVFSAIGAQIKVCGAAMEIVGGPLYGGIVDSNNDHRIAMACAVAGLTTRYGISIINGGCVVKSYPDFFHALQYIRGRS